MFPAFKAQPPPPPPPNPPPPPPPPPPRQIPPLEDSPLESLTCFPEPIPFERLFGDFTLHRKEFRLFRKKRLAEAEGGAREKGGGPGGPLFGGVKEGSAVGKKGGSGNPGFFSGKRGRVFVFPRTFLSIVILVPLAGEKVLEHLVCSGFSILGVTLIWRDACGFDGPYPGGLLTRARGFGTFDEKDIFPEGKGRSLGGEKGRERTLRSCFRRFQGKCPKWMFLP